MKKTLKFEFFVLALSCLVTGAMFSGLALLPGCGTNAPTKAAQAEQIVITTVNQAVKILVGKINAGQLTQSQIDKFHTAYDAYFAAQQVARAAIEKLNAAGASAATSDVATAQAAVNDAEQTLISLANKLITGQPI